MARSRYGNVQSMVRAKLLLVDDEERVLRALERVFRDQYQLTLATHPLQALELLEQHRFDVVICDQRMPAMTGVSLLREARKRSPHSVRLLLTGYADIPAIVASINEGEIHRYLHKPWDVQQLQHTVTQAVELAMQLRDLDSTTTSSGSQRLPLLVYDDDPHTATTLSTLASSRFEITATSALDQALAFVASHPVPILVSEVQMGGVETLSVIASMKSACPDLVTIVLTAQQDANVLVRLVNQCQIFRFLHKPLSSQRLNEALGAAAAVHDRALAQQHQPTLPPEPVAAAPLTRRISEYFRRRLA